MASSDGVHDGDQLGTTSASTNTSFSQLLFASDDDAVNDMSQLFNYSSPVNSSKMLCFGSDCQTQILLQPTITSTPQKSGLTCTDSSSSATKITNNATVSVNTKFNRKRNESVQGGGRCNTSNEAKTIVACQRTTKKTRVETNTTTSTGHAKVRKEKLGERITALQQLVSPFGKTDTASVLHEAMGYIRFLQEQVQVLCSPYLQHLTVAEGENGEEKVKDLRSRGLCLVPVDCTMHVASSNGADYWSPATMANFSASTSTKPSN